MIVWCTIAAVYMNFYIETAARGKVKHETGTSYVVDFSKYAKEKDYIGDYSEYTVDKDKCMTEKELKK